MKRKTRESAPVRTVSLAALGAALLLLCGCEDQTRFDHKPPPGQGSLVVDNRTFDDLSVFLDGRPQPEARSRNDRIYDLAPGTYRLVMDQQGGDRYHARDIDIVQGRLTVAEVRIDPYRIDRFNVSVRLD